MTKEKKILLSPPCTNELEEQYISLAFQEQWIAPSGPQVSLFEEELKQFLKTDVYPVIVSSGTAAIHLSLLALGITKGDIVLVQTLTFVATANPVGYTGATPVFIDSEPDSWNMCAEQLEKAITYYKQQGKIPKAIIPVSLYGMPYNRDKIHAISQKYNIPVVEDSAEALGSTYSGQPCGTLGKYGIFSFNGNKIITMSSGGAVITYSREEADYIRFLANQAKENVPYYQHNQVGYNYAASSVLAALGRAQLTKLTGFVNRRRAIHNFYREIFSVYSYIKVLTEPSKELYSNHWLSCILIEENPGNKSNHGLKEHLERHGIESRYVWKPMHLQPLFKDAAYFGESVAEELFNKGLCLPSSNLLTEQDLLYIRQTIEVYLTF